MSNKTWKVGELSKLTSITIRTLHHYDEIGLLFPLSHTDVGHRLYSASDILKLQQIMSLKQLGFSLGEIKDFFENPEYNPKEVISLQLEKLNEEIKLKKELQKQLQEIWEVFDSCQKPTSEQFLKAIELIKNQNKYFTQEQKLMLKKNYHKLNNQEGKEFANSLIQLIFLLQTELDKGTPSNNPMVMELAKRWQEGINFFTGGDKGIVLSAEQYYVANPAAPTRSGMSGELYEYIKKALQNHINFSHDKRHPKVP